LPLIQTLARGETVAVNDTATDSQTRNVFDDFFGPRQIRGFIAVPYIEEGSLVWTMVVTASGESRVWPQDEIELAQDGH
jgi:GAF domain-containing protein